MRRFRFSIASLLGVVLFSGIGIAALRAATEPWNSAVFGGAILVLLLATLKAIHGRERRRAFWLGFALFGWAFLGAGLMPSVASRLPTARGLEWLAARRPVAQAAFVADLDVDGSLDVFVANGRANLVKSNGTFMDVTTGAPASTTKFRGAGNSYYLWSTLTSAGGSNETFVAIGHVLAALILAFLGGHVSRFLFDREKLRAAAPTPSSPTGASA